MTAGKYPAPLKVLEVVRTGLVEGEEDGYEAEAKVSYFFDGKTRLQAFGALSQTPQSAALIGLFSGSTEAKKSKYGEGLKVKKIAVIGAGLMGAGIANVSIDKVCLMLS